MKLTVNKNKMIRIRLKSFNSQLLVSSCNKIVKALENSCLNSISLIAFPTNKKIYCVLRSPHVDKDSREHFEVRIHKRMLEIHYDSQIKLFDLLYNINLPSGVLYRIDLK